MVEITSEILLVDKPVGITSFDVIRRLRKSLGIRKMGHAGTLDPLASGLMIIGVGTGTKRLAEYIKLDKVYETQILLGQKRSTSDMEGEVLAEKELRENVSEHKLIETVDSLVGSLKLPVSSYSAIKQGGVPLYKKVRQGKVIDELPVREMVVHEAEFLGSEAVEINEKKFQLVSVRFHVGSGTYIRSLAEELGSRLGYPATVFELRRTKIGPFDIKNASEV